MGIWREVIVVADDLIFVEGEHQHNAQADRRGRPAVGRREKTAINQNQQGGSDGQVRKNQRAERNAENLEQQCVEILGERSARQIMQVPIEHCALVNPPRQIELQTEIDDYVRPFAPGNRCRDHERHCHHRQSGPI